MTLTKTPICDFGKKAENFQLNSTNNKIISLQDIKGEKIPYSDFNIIQNYL